MKVRVRGFGRRNMEVVSIFENIPKQCTCSQSLTGVEALNEQAKHTGIEQGRENT